MNTKKKTPQSGAAKTTKGVKMKGAPKQVETATAPVRVAAEPSAISLAPRATAMLAAATVKEVIRHRATIAGFVTDARSGQAIANAVIEVVSQESKTESRPDGFYYFLDLSAGPYTLNVSAPHLGSRYGTATVSNIEVKNDPQGRPLFDVKAKVKLSPTALVGQVKDASNNQPIAKALVQLLGSETKTLTGQDGKYVLSGLTKGSPNVQVSATGFITVTQKVSLNAGQETTANFSLTK